jgi:F-box interacting protein
VHGLLENPSATIADDHHFQLDNSRVSLDVVGSYNGLLCLVGCEFYSIFYHGQKRGQIVFYLLNPATRTFTNKIGATWLTLSQSKWKFGFGYDNSTDTYKILAFSLPTNDVRVLNLGHNVWRNIQNFPVVPFEDVGSYPGTSMTDGVYVSGTVNWLGIRNQSQYGYDKFSFISVERFVIISMDFSTETYCQLLPPQSFDEVSLARSAPLAALMDSLCFSYDFNGTDFIIWQMKEFRVQESWTRFLKISYYNLLSNDNPFTNCLFLFPLCLSENGGTLILACRDGEQAILYNLSDNTVEKTRNTDTVEWFRAKNYVESLVWTG